MTLGQRLTQLRTQAGLSQDALAEQLGVSRQSVSKWETDGSIPDLNRLVKLSTVFGVTLDELVKGEAGQSPEPEADGSSASASESGQSAAAPAAELLRLHRQKLAGILLIAISLAVTLLNVALLFVTLPVFAAGVLCLLAAAAGACHRVDTMDLCPAHHPICHQHQHEPADKSRILAAYGAACSFAGAGATGDTGAPGLADPAQPAGTEGLLGHLAGTAGCAVASRTVSFVRQPAPSPDRRGAAVQLFPSAFRRFLPQRPSGRSAVVVLCACRCVAGAPHPACRKTSKKLSKNPRRNPPGILYKPYCFQCSFHTRTGIGGSPRRLAHRQERTVKRFWSSVSRWASTASRSS